MLGCCQSAALPPLTTVAETAQGFKDARHLTSYLSQQLRTDHQRQAASRSYKIIHDGLRSLQVSVVHQRPIQQIANATDSANHFSVKLSLFICMLAACSGSPPQCSTFSSICISIAWQALHEEASNVSLYQVETKYEQCTDSPNYKKANKLPIVKNIYIELVALSHLE